MLRTIPCLVFFQIFQSHLVYTTVTSTLKPPNISEIQADEIGNFTGDGLSGNILVVKKQMLRAVTLRKDVVSIIRLKSTLLIQSSWNSTIPSRVVRAFAIYRVNAKLHNDL
ncbi:hypothetical protein Trydic_g16084 [Trypoxylus dichotomus]